MFAQDSLGSFDDVVQLDSASGSSIRTRRG